MDNRVKVLMVCLGNICRSPLAEGILKSKLNSKDYLVESAGTGAYHVGNLPDKRSIQVAKKHNIDITDQRARQFSPKDFQIYDYIFVMDSSNYKNVISLATNKQEVKKVSLILNELPNTENSEVPDPYYGGDSGFEHVYDLLNKACENIASHI